MRYEVKTFGHYTYINKENIYAIPSFRHFIAIECSSEAKMHPWCLSNLGAQADELVICHACSWATP